MKKTALAALICLAITGGVQAQTLQPNMSAQDVRAAMTPEEGHLIVPILFMIFLILTASRGAGAVAPVLTPA
jgi:hypothetical protein